MKRHTATIGMFDGVHSGHRHLLESLKRTAAAEGTAPLVVTMDRHPLATLRPELTPPLLMEASERISALRAIVPDVVEVPFTPEMSRLTAGEFITMLRERYGVESLHLGFNHRFGSDRLTTHRQYAEAGAAAGVRVTIATEYRTPDGRAVNSSAIRRSLSHFATVMEGIEMLGHPYLIRGRVVHGRSVGREIGFPTANIEPHSPAQLIPARGVYAADAVIEGREHRRAMVNIGCRPTFGEHGGELSIEAHLIDFEGDIYGSEIALEITDTIRREQRFDSVEALVAQLRADRKYFL